MSTKVRTRAKNQARSSGSKVRVTRLLPVLDFGGVETRAVNQCRQMDFEGIDFRICTFWKKGDAAKKIEATGIPIDVLDVAPAIRNPRATLELMRYLREQPTDILHCAINEANFHGSIAGRLSGVACTVVEEVGDPLVRSTRGHAVIGLTMHLANHCVGVSKPVANYLSEDLYVPRSKVTHIDNGVPAVEPPMAEERAEARREFGIPLDAMVVGSVGRLDDKHKRFSHLIEAVSLISSPEDNVYVMIVGEGRDKEAIRNAADELGIGDRVILTGYQSDTRKMYGMMDVFGLLSEQEAFGLVVAEAMFCELPVVVSDVGGMSEIVVEGETGFKVPRLQPDRAAERLASLLDSEEMRVRMGAAGRQRALKKYSTERYTADVRELYLKLRDQFVE